MMKSLIFTLAAAYFMMSATCAFSDSLYNPAPTSNSTAVANSSGSVTNTAATSQTRPPIGYFSDTKAHNVGDILTVVITENASGSSTAATSGSKSDSANFGPGVGSVLRLIRNFGLSGNINDTATGTTTRVDNLTATIAVTVQQVLPNGDLMVQGARSVGTNSEIQTVTLTGIVRPADISPTNTVQSPQVANAQIRYSGKGPVGEIQHDGIVRKIFKILF